MKRFSLFNLTRLSAWEFAPKSWVLCTHMILTVHFHITNSVRSCNVFFETSGTKLPPASAQHIVVMRICFTFAHTQKSTLAWLPLPLSHTHYCCCCVQQHITCHKHINKLLVVYGNAGKRRGLKNAASANAEKASMQDFIFIFFFALGCG